MIYIYSCDEREISAMDFHVFLKSVKKTWKYMKMTQIFNFQFITYGVMLDVVIQPSKEAKNKIDKLR